MKKLKQEEIPEILPIIKGRNTLLRVQLLELKVGDVLFMALDEWKTKTSPRHVVHSIKKKYGMRYEYGRTTDGTGWLFKRVA